MVDGVNFPEDNIACYGMLTFIQSLTIRQPYLAYPLYSIPVHLSWLGMEPVSAQHRQCRELMQSTRLWVALLPLGAKLLIDFNSHMNKVFTADADATVLEGGTVGEVVIVPRVLRTRSNSYRNGRNIPKLQAGQMYKR